MPTATAKNAKTAACQPKLGPGKTADLPGRCRVRTVCFGEAPASALRLRRLRINGAVTPTLCCEACAEGLEAA